MALEYGQCSPQSPATHRLSLRSGRASRARWIVGPMDDLTDGPHISLVVVFDAGRRNETPFSTFMRRASSPFSFGNVTLTSVCTKLPGSRRPWPRGERDDGARELAPAYKYMSAIPLDDTPFAKHCGTRSKAPSSMPSRLSKYVSYEPHPLAHVRLFARTCDAHSNWHMSPPRRTSNR